MSTTLSFAIAAAGLLLSLTCGSAQTPAKPTNSVSLGQSHFVAFGTNKIHYVTAGKGNHTIVFVMVGAMEGMFGEDQPDWDVKKATVPVVIINAPNPMWTDEYKDYVRSLSPKTGYRMIDGVGHWLMLEKPGEFNAALIGMLRKFGLIAE